MKWITIPGLSDYKKVIAEMENKVAEVIDGYSDETIYLVEHQDIYTAGISTPCEHLTNLTIGNVPILSTNRGGKLTYHGKGQRVIYPILNLASPGRNKDVSLYVRMLEQWIINSLACVDIKAYTIKDKIGIWVSKENKESKIASIGIKIKKWVTYHGVSINISSDLSKFDAIIPCGIKNMASTSLWDLQGGLQENLHGDLGIKITMNEFDEILKKQFEQVF